jgi:TRAP-type mannitol/chloroaromatic compound transport system permease large subunit
MSAIMFLGFFIDFIEISYIVVPILLPVAETVGGFSLFYLKGVCPPEVRTLDIYKGVLP